MRGLFAAGLVGTLVTAPGADGGGRVVLEGVDRYRAMEAMVESVRVVLAYRGETWSPAWLHGVAGSAFRIGGICPCAPTCTAGIGPAMLAELLGYEVTAVPVAEGGPRFDETVHRIKEEVRRGRPVVVWHAFTMLEYDVVAGFDEEKAAFLGRGSYQGMDDDYAEAPWGRGGTCDVSPDDIAVLIGDKTSEPDLRDLELDALREAVRHGRSQLGVDKLGTEEWTFLEGIACYDRWVRDWQDPARSPQLGDRYCLGIYSSTHALAGQFLAEIAEYWEPASPELLEGAKAFTEEAKALIAVRELIGWGTPDEPDAARNAEAARLLGEARDRYAEGIAAIERALAVIDN